MHKNDFFRIFVDDKFGIPSFSGQSAKPSQTCFLLIQYGWKWWVMAWEGPAIVSVSFSTDGGALHKYCVTSQLKAHSSSSSPFGQSITPSQTHVRCWFEKSFATFFSFNEEINCCWWKFDADDISMIMNKSFKVQTGTQWPESQWYSSVGEHGLGVRFLQGAISSSPFGQSDFPSHILLPLIHSPLAHLESNGHTKSVKNAMKIKSYFESIFFVILRHSDPDSNFLGSIILSTETSSSVLFSIHSQWRTFFSIFHWDIPNPPKYRLTWNYFPDTAPRYSGNFPRRWHRHSRRLRRICIRPLYTEV